MATNPLADEDDIMARTFYTPGVPAGYTNGAAADEDEDELDEARRRDKPSHYRVVSVSLYLDDIERIDTIIKELKRRGFTKMNRSALIRFAIDTVNIDNLPRQY